MVVIPLNTWKFRTNILPNTVFYNLFKYDRCSESKPVLSYYIQYI